MADDASAPAYANSPTDPSTWSPAYAAQMQAAASQYAATQALAAAQVTLATLQPCVFVLADAWASQADAIKALAKASEDDLVTSWGNNLATTMSGFATEFRTRFLGAGGKLPA